MTVSTSTSPAARADSRMRRLPVWGFVVLVVVWLGAIWLLVHVTGISDGTSYGHYPTIEQVVRGVLASVVVGSVTGLLAIGVLRWWRPVFVEEPSLRMPRWTWIFPLVLLAAALVGTSYSKLADKGAGFTLVLLGSSLLIGVSEEGMFRGIGVTTFRRAGFSEGHVALWTSALFGLAHITNIFREGNGAIAQVFITAFAGYSLYITRRVTGSLIAAMAVHGLYDFAAFSNSISIPEGYGGIALVLADFVLAIVALSTIREVFPKRGGSPTVWAPAGWYVDPGAPTRWRYWDGLQWTSNISPGS